MAYVKFVKAGLFHEVFHILKIVHFVSVDAVGL